MYNFSVHYVPELSNILFSFYKGFLMGFIILKLSKILDNTISIQSKHMLIQKDRQLFKKSLTMNRINLLFVGPIFYIFIKEMFLVDEINFSISHYLYMLLIHNLGYFIVHKQMHTNKYLKSIHFFHHQFDKILIPSIGNAVSVREFILAYLFPFVIGAFILNPSEISFFSSLFTISVLNMLIHSNELRNMKWLKYLVSPKNHIFHHEKREKHYSAPLINFDNIISDMV